MTEPNRTPIPWQQQSAPLPQGQHPAEPPRIMPTAPPALRGEFQPPRELTELEYHRLSHADARTRWWSPLLEGLTVGFIYAIFNAVAGLIFAVWAMNSGVTEADFTLEGLQTKSLSSPAFFFLMFGTVALMFPALWLARLICRPKPWGLIHSVAGRMRWSWLFLCMGISIVLFVLLPVVFELVTGGSFAVEARIPATTLIWMMVLVFLLVPLQCYAEELVFRGYLMQTLGRWLKHPAWAIILPAPLFMLGHAYDMWGQLSILVMGLAAGFMVWYTGGLEASIAMHVVNNVYLMFMGVIGLVDPYAQEGSTFVDFLWATGIELLLVVVIMYAARKVGVARRATFPVVISPKRWAQMSAEEKAQTIR